MKFSPGLYRRRRIVNLLSNGFAIAASLFGVFWLAWILATLLAEGIPGLDWHFFSMSTPPAGEAGGLLNAIYGSFIMTFTATVIGAPIGILAGTYLAEYAKNSKFAEIVRFLNDILLSAPSIVIGLFIYEIIVRPMHGSSAWAGSAALAIIVIPVVVRTTENMLQLVPSSLREAAAALGSPMWRRIVFVSYRSAFQGLLTGILLAVARISGETAPLLFTALNAQFWSTDMGAPMASLPATIYRFALSPYPDWQRLAWAGALLITFAILGLNILARLLSNWVNTGPSS